MSDDKTKRGKQDGSRVSASEDYEVAYFAKPHGNDRATLNAAETLKAKNPDG